MNSTKINYELKVIYQTHRSSYFSRAWSHTVQGNIGDSNSRSFIRDLGRTLERERDSERCLEFVGAVRRNATGREISPIEDNGRQNYVLHLNCTWWRRSQGCPKWSPFYNIVETGPTKVPSLNATFHVPVLIDSSTSVFTI